MALTDAAIRKKALWLHQSNGRDKVEPFKASPTWMRHFKKRHRIHRGAFNVGRYQEPSVEQKARSGAGPYSVLLDIWLGKFPAQLPADGADMPDPADLGPPARMDPQDFLIPPPGEYLLETPPSPSRRARESRERQAAAVAPATASLLLDTRGRTDRPEAIPSIAVSSPSSLLTSSSSDDDLREPGALTSSVRYAFHA